MYHGMVIEPPIFNEFWALAACRTLNTPKIFFDFLIKDYDNINYI